MADIEESGAVEPEAASSHEPGTTHAAYGAGNPRLMLGDDGWAWEGEGQRAFPMTREVTTIGSSPEADVQLAGIAAVHAEIRHDDRDEYVLHLRYPGTAPTVAGGHYVDKPGDQPLHSGSTFTVGEWSLTFARDEFADHTRPFGGREGGELSEQTPQPPRPDYRAEHDRAEHDRAEHDRAEHDPAEHDRAEHDRAGGLDAQQPQGDLAKDDQAVGE